MPKKFKYLGLGILIVVILSAIILATHFDFSRISGTEMLLMIGGFILGVHLFIAGLVSLFAFLTKKFFRQKVFKAKLETGDDNLDDI